MPQAAQLSSVLTRKRYCDVHNKYNIQCNGTAGYLVFYDKEDASTGLYACGQHLAKAVKTLQAKTNRLTYNVYVLPQIGAKNEAE